MIRTLDVSDLPDPLVEAIESLVSTYRTKMRAPLVPPPVPPVGWLKGKWELPDSFFDPLPDDVLDLFDGNGGAAGRSGGRS